MAEAIKIDSIAILICYIGKLPWYFNYFVHSCKYNPTVEFVLVTDDTSYVGVIPGNVKFFYQSLTGINSLASEKLGFATNITTGYKLCDFKPCYGVIFSDLLKDYDYWGHGDIDVIFGDIRAFLTQDLLAYHDLISVRHDFLTGQFLVFRNCEKMNNLFMQSKDYKMVLSSEKHFCFDETNFQWQGFTDGKHYSEIQSEIESMTHVVKRLEAQNYINVFFDFIIIEGLPGRLKWCEGKLYYRNKYEILLYHLVLFKRKCVPSRLVKNIPGSFLITPSRIRHGV